MRRGLALICVAHCACVPATLPTDGAVSPDAVRPTDGGADAAGEPDAGPSAPADAGTPDAGTTDAGTLDAGTTDAGTLDSGAADGGAPDAGPATCAVAGLEFACVDVTACGGTAVTGRCGRELRNVCCAEPPPCSVGGAPGVCVDVAVCPGTSTPGLCPGGAEIQCCTRPEEACDPAARPTPNAGLVEVAYDGRCPDGMVFVGPHCVDRYEASLVRTDGAPWSPFANPGDTPVRAVSLAFALPQGYISGDQASAACAAAGKRLCTDSEWLAACRGPADHVYPYGDAREPGRCNDARDDHPAVEYFGTNDPSVFGMLDHPCLNQLPAGLALTGAHSGCQSAAGAFDMMGNLHEWTADPAGTFRGGFYVDTVRNGDGCRYRTTAHTRPYWDYSTGFRCCADAN